MNERISVHELKHMTQIHKTFINTEANTRGSKTEKRHTKKVEFQNKTGREQDKIQTLPLSHTQVDGSTKM